MDAETLDMLLAKESLKKGWAECKTLYAARILRHLLKDVKDKEMRDAIRIVIKFLEEYKLDKLE